MLLELLHSKDEIILLTQLSLLICEPLFCSFSRLIFLFYHSDSHLNTTIDVTFHGVSHYIMYPGSDVIMLLNMVQC